MGTKLQPGKFDCYANALPDEPMFVLLARDPDFMHIVNEWAACRLQRILRGDYPESDRALVREAIQCSEAGGSWRENNPGKWRGYVPEETVTIPKKEFDQIDTSAALLEVVCRKADDRYPDWCEFIKTVKIGD